MESTVAAAVYTIAHRDYYPTQCGGEVAPLAPGVSQNRSKLLINHPIDRIASYSGFVLEQG
jgi:hypothetical protein